MEEIKKRNAIKTKTREHIEKIKTSCEIDELKRIEKRTESIRQTTEQIAYDKYANRL